MSKGNEKVALSGLISEIETAVQDLKTAAAIGQSEIKFPGGALVLRTFSEILIILRRIEHDISEALPAVKKMREPEISPEDFERNSNLRAFISLDLKILYEWTNHVFRIVEGHPEWGSFHEKHKAILKPFEIIRSKMITHFPENDLYKSGRGLAGHGWRYTGDDLEGAEMIWSISLYDTEVVGELKSLQSDLSKSIAEFRALESSDDIVALLCQKFNDIDDKQLQCRVEKVLKRVTIVAKSPRDVAVILRSFILEFRDIALGTRRPLPEELNKSKDS